MKKNLNAIVFSLAIVIAAIFLAYAYKNKTNTKGAITVTGLGEKCKYPNFPTRQN